MAGAADAAPTFSKDVAPILYTNWSLPPAGRGRADVASPL
jgi:hypothetical protein